MPSKLNLYQINPEYDCGHRNSWSSSLASYHSRAWKESQIIIKARQDYCFSATLRIDENLSVSEHRKLWCKIARNLMGYIYFSVRESTTTNHLHYHFVIYAGEEAVYISKRLNITHFNKCISTALSSSKFNLQINPKQADDGWILYILKTCEWGKKPLLFIKRLGLAKVMYSKAFFPKKKADVWREIWVPRWAENDAWEQHLETNPEVRDKMAVRSRLIDGFFDRGTLMRHVPSYRHFKDTYKYLSWRQRKLYGEAQRQHIEHAERSGACSTAKRSAGC